MMPSAPSIITSSARLKNALFRSCPKNDISLPLSCLYALSLSASFVLSLYVFVPKRIRQLDRDNVKQIKWRLAASTSVGLIAIATYPFLFCSLDHEKTDTSAFHKLGFTLTMKPLLQIFVHICSLYLGSMVAALLHVSELVLLQQRQGRSPNIFRIGKSLFIDPIFHPLWPQIRNLWLAPALEELVFRACIVGPLASSLSSPTHAVWIAPLFFGTAHVHHAYLKWKDGHLISSVAVSTMFQFAYTTLFGAYVTHVFLRTNSLPAIILSHQICNYMGLPDWSFFRPQFGYLSLIHRFRWIIMVAYILGGILFAIGFRNF